MEIELSDQVIISAKTRQGLLNKKQASWEVFTWLVPTETREENSVREQEAKTASKAGAKDDSKAGRGDVLAEEGYAPEHRKQRLSSDCCQVSQQSSA